MVPSSHADFAPWAFGTSPSHRPWQNGFAERLIGSIRRECVDHIIVKAPRWHLGALWVSDMRAGKVFRIDLDGKVTIIAEVPTRPFGLGFLPDGSLLVASMTQRLVLKFGAEKPAIHADLSDVASGYLRDLVVARNGNAL